MAGNQTDSSDITETDVEAREWGDIVAEDPLVRLLTPESKVKILRALIVARGEKDNPSGICERAAIGRNAWYDNRDELLEVGAIEEAGSAGNSPMYRVNMDDPLVQRLVECREIAAERFAGRDVDA